MSTLLQALERIEFGGPPRRAATPAAPPIVVAPELPRGELVAEPVIIDDHPVEVTPPPTFYGPFADAASGLLRLFPQPAVVALVGCELASPCPELAGELRTALQDRGHLSIEVCTADVLDARGPADVVASKLRQRARLVIAALSAEEATSRADMLKTFDGVLLVVELERTTSRAADVTSAILRMRGAKVCGSLVIS